MKLIKLLITLSFTILLTACMTPKGWVKPDDTELLQHEKTNTKFPEIIGDYKRIDVIPSSNAYVGDQVIYQNSEKDRISVYIKFDQEANLYFEYSKIALVKGGVTKAIDDKPLSFANSGKKLIAQTQRGYGKVYTYKVGDKKIYMSQMESISVFDMGTYAFKIRSSFLLNPDNPKVALKNARKAELTILNGLFN